MKFIFTSVSDALYPLPKSVKRVKISKKVREAIDFDYSSNAVVVEIRTIRQLIELINDKEVIVSNSKFTLIGTNVRLPAIKVYDDYNE